MKHTVRKHPTRRPLLFKSFAASLSALLVLCLAAAPAALAQDEKEKRLDGHLRDRALVMLNIIKSDIKKNYYDENFHGIDLDARFKEAEEKIKQQATSLNHALGIIAQALIDLNDSHTYFVPPPRPSRVDYGWQMTMVGDKCYVSAVKPGSDAEKKGLRPGDEVWTIDGYGPVRENLWKIKYSYYSVRPRGGMSLVIRKPDGKEVQLDVLAKVRQGKQLVNLVGGSGNDLWEMIREAENEDRLHRHRYQEFGEELFVWKMPGFDLEEAQVDDMMGKIKKRKALVLDLRGNGGGLVKTLERLAGHFFESDVKIADLKGRKEMKPIMAKTRGDRVFKGQLVVLVDSESGSAAELFARLVQLEKRGTVIGDRTSGKVMQSRYHPHELGVDTVSFYGVSVTNADVIMSDGKSLEGAGVVPDLLMLPAATDLAAGRDTVLAHAASLVGVKLDPEKAGAMFPVEWRK